MQDEKSKSPKLCHNKALWKLFQKLQDSVRLTLYFPKQSFFFYFHLQEAFKPPGEKWASYPRFVNGNLNEYHDFSYIKQFHDPSFVSKRCYNFKRFQSDFLIFFQNYPLNQCYRDHQFCHFSTAKIPSWYMAFIRKMVFQRKSNAFPINL